MKKIKYGIHPSKVQGKRKHKQTQPKEGTKANNQQESNKDTMQREFMIMK